MEMLMDFLRFAAARIQRGRPSGQQVRNGIFAYKLKVHTNPHKGVSGTPFCNTVTITFQSSRKDNGTN